MNLNLCFHLTFCWPLISSSFGQQFDAPAIVQDIAFGQDDFDFLLGDLGIPIDYEARRQPAVQPGMPGQPGVEVGLTVSPSFDWRETNKISPVRNQRRCAACYAFAGVAVFEAMIRNEFGDQSLDLAEQQPISCDRKQSGCKGGWMGVFSFWESNPPHAESCNPFTGAAESPVDCAAGCGASGKSPYRVEKWVTVEPSDILTIKQNIQHQGPGYLSFKVYYPFYNYWRGYDGEVYEHPDNPGAIRGGHACQVIGWDDEREAWLLQNSWGLSPPGPLKDGSFYLPYDLHKELNYGFAFITVKKDTDSEEGNYGGSPIHCANHVPCYQTREPKSIHRKYGIEYLSGCYCKNSRCQIDFKLNKQPDTLDCIFCGTKCRDNSFYDIIQGSFK